MANEGRRPNVDGEAIKDAISNFIMLWSDTRPDNRIDLNQDPEVQQVLREIDPEGRFLDFEFVVAGSIILPDLRSEHFQMAVRWEAQFREKYMDESFKALADRVSET